MVVEVAAVRSEVAESGSAELAGDGVGAASATTAVATGGCIGVGSSSVSCGQALTGSLRSEGSAEVLVDARVKAGERLEAEAVVAVFWECCECECSPRTCGFCNTSDWTSRGSISGTGTSCTSLAPCSASLLSEMLFRSVLGARGGPASLPALAVERVVVLVAELRRRNFGKNLRELLMLLIPASSRRPWA